MEVRFPLGRDIGWPGWKGIEDIVVKVNNQTVSTRVIDGTGQDQYFENVDGMSWAGFEVFFPAGQDVSLLVTYTLEASGIMPFIQFDYIFATGIGWKDTIGSATLIVSFPYEISNLNVLPDYSGSDDSISHKSGPNQLTWVYTDFEPQPEDNFEITLVAPSVWNEVLNEKSKISENPNDGESWGRLGMFYKQIAFSSRGKGFRTWILSEDKGAQDLIRLSTKAYQRAVSLKPNDPLWHAGYADLLGYYAYWARASEGIDTRLESYNSLIQIQSALELAPEDPTVQKITERLVDELEGGLIKNENSYQFPWLTATPILSIREEFRITETPVPSKQPTTETFVTTSTPKVNDPTSMPTSDQQPQKRLPICGSVLLVPFGLILWFSQRKTG